MLDMTDYQLNINWSKEYTDGCKKFLDRHPKLVKHTGQKHTMRSFVSEVVVPSFLDSFGCLPGTAHLLQPIREGDWRG
jgi:hypothetical protein